jgi:hypothetical protein
MKSLKSAPSTKGRGDLRPFLSRMPPADNDRELFLRGRVRMGPLACMHLGNIPDFAWEATAASAKVARRRGRRGGGAGRPAPLPLPAPAPISGTLRPTRQRRS